jgi:hypothetical protein
MSACQHPISRAETEGRCHSGSTCHATASGSLFHLTAAKGYGGRGVVPVIPGCEPLEFLADTVWNCELNAKGDLFGDARMSRPVFDTR